MTDLAVVLAFALSFALIFLGFWNSALDAKKVRQLEKRVQYLESKLESVSLELSWVRHH
jgi:hypothetical protein